MCNLATSQNNKREKISIKSTGENLSDCNLIQERKVNINWLLQWKVGAWPEG